ncbi:UNVERIFIED_CONTAM: hypothetical protein PYX00_001719 [Menopon gallinae]|uniref:Protein-lysine N-methyltransferase SMYD4 n=1 Tax=Menopon gallinae TaxID=328185 RepID=A0AAW2IE62_9NEOP
MSLPNTIGDYFESLTNDLYQDTSELNRDDPISFCWKKSAKLKEYVKDAHQPRARKSDPCAYGYIRQGNLAREPYDRLQLYTNAVFSAQPKSRALSQAYSSRSTVLYLMGHYRESINDIDMALSILSIGSPERPSLLVLKSVLLSAVGENEKAKKVLTSAHSLRDKLPSEDIRLNSEINNAETIIKRGKLIEKQEELELPKLKHGENPTFPGASNCVELKYSEEKGRHVIAKCDINVGDVLFLEKSFSFVIHNKFYCEACCKYVVAPVPCEYCTVVQYCSEKCRDSAYESFHKFECGYKQALMYTGIAQLALRIILKAAGDFDTLKKRISSLNKGKSIIGEDIYENVYNLLDHTASLDITDLIKYSLVAIFISILIFDNSYGTPTDLNIQSCANVILRHIVQVISNSHSICTSNSASPTSGLDLKERRIGSAIYPSVSMMNHSCETSIVEGFHQDIFVGRACKKIKKGEEVYSNYGPNCILTDRLSRQKRLKDQYHFECKCPRCSEEYDLYDILNSLKCKKCKGPLVDYAQRVDVDNKISICLSCGTKEFFSAEKLMKLKSIRELMDEGELMMDLNDWSSALNAYIMAWKLGINLLYKLHKDLESSADNIAECLIRMGEMKKGLRFMRCALLSTGARFGYDSLEFAFQSKEYSDVIKMHCQVPLGKDRNELKDLRSEGFKFYEMSEKILRKMYGNSYPEKLRKF